MPMIKNTEELPLIMRLEDVTELLGVGKSTVSDWTRSGKLPAHYVGSVPFFNKNELLEFLGEKPKDAAIIQWLKEQLNSMTAEQAGKIAG